MPQDTLPPEGAPDSSLPQESSLLREILETSNQSHPIDGTFPSQNTPAPSPVSGEPSGSTNPVVPPAPKKTKEPISLGMFLKIIGSFFFVAAVFFGSFLAYIGLNPDQALFFVNTFNIDRNEVQNLLKALINGSFGFVMIVVSIIWIVSLFRAFWTPKDLKRKKLLSWLSAGVIGGILFSILAFWAYLFEIVGATDYSNLSGSVLIYDQDLYTHENYRETARIENTQNLIGPVTLLFDIGANAAQIKKRNLVDITGFNIDFNGAKCSDGRSTITGTNPENEQSIVCTFDKIQPYTLRGTYTTKNRLGEVKEIPIALPDIEIRGIVDIKYQKNTRGENIVTFNATSLKRLGSPLWTYESGKRADQPTVTETVTPKAQALCLSVFTSSCDRIFLIEDKEKKTVEGTLVSQQDPLDARLFHLSFTGLTLNQNEITHVEWLIDGQTVICQNQIENCDYTFLSYGKFQMQATLFLANTEKYTFQKDIEVAEPLAIVRHVKVLNREGEVLNNETNYDRQLRAYVLDDLIIPPQTLVFDARDIVSANPGYVLEDVTWKISNGKTNEEKKGVRVDIDFNQPLRYTVEGIYTFKKTNAGTKNETKTVQENIIINIERKNLTPRLDVRMDSDYIPIVVTVDASRSESVDSEIKKFIFDFGEGKPVSEGDAIKQYEYTTAGNKTITLTILTENGEKASIKRTLVLKDQVRKIDFLPSLSPAMVGNPVDFDAVGTNGQIQDYIWNFGDNTPVSHGYNVSHTYQKAGKYTITMTVIYTDGTREDMQKIFEVVESL